LWRPAKTDDVSLFFSSLDRDFGHLALLTLNSVTSARSLTALSTNDLWAF
jgi:hypothetical protein